MIDLIGWNGLSRQSRWVSCNQIRSLNNMGNLLRNLNMLRCCLLQQLLLLLWLLWLLLWLLLLGLSEPIITKMYTRYMSIQITSSRCFIHAVVAFVRLVLGFCSVGMHTQNDHILNLLSFLLLFRNVHLLNVGCDHFFES